MTDSGPHLARPRPSWRHSGLCEPDRLSCTSGAANLDHTRDLAPQSSASCYMREYVGLRAEAHGASPQPASPPVMSDPRPRPCTKSGKQKDGRCALESVDCASNFPLKDRIRASVLAEPASDWARQSRAWRGKNSALGEHLPEACLHPPLRQRRPRVMAIIRIFSQCAFGGDEGLLQHVRERHINPPFSVEARLGLRQRRQRRMFCARPCQGRDLFRNDGLHHHGGMSKGCCCVHHRVGCAWEPQCAESKNDSFKHRSVWNM